MATWPAALFAVLGVLVIVVAWRGIRCGGAPICRRCRYDLAGIVGRSQRCPECGADLCSRRGIDRVPQRRLWVVLAAAVVLFAVGAAILGERARRWVTDDGWLEVMPVWVLEQRAQSARFESSIEARGVLWRRVADGELDPAVLLRLFDAGVPTGERAVGGSGSAQWAAFADWLWEWGMLDDERRREYVEDLMSSWVAITPAARAVDDGPIGVLVECDIPMGPPTVVGGVMSLQTPSLPARLIRTHRLRAELSELIVDGHRVEQSPPHGGVIELHADRSVMLRADGRLPLGSHHLQATFTFAVEPGCVDAPLGAIDAEWTQTVNWTLAVVDAETVLSAVELVADPAREPGAAHEPLTVDNLANALFVRFGSARATSERTTMVPQPIRSLPRQDLALAAEVYATHRDETVLLGWLVASPFETVGMTWIGTPPWSLWPDAASVDLELRPSIPLMAMLLERASLGPAGEKLRVWNSSILIPGVSIEPMPLSPWLVEAWTSERPTEGP